MVFFHPGGHALFLLALCIIAPLLLLSIIGLLVSHGHLKQLAMVESSRSGLAIDTYEDRELVTLDEAHDIRARQAAVAEDGSHPHREGIAH